jgi:hypothetical protein
MDGIGIRSSGKPEAIKSPITYLGSCSLRRRGVRTPDLPGVMHLTSARRCSITIDAPKNTFVMSRHSSLILSTAFYRLTLQSPYMETPTRAQKTTRRRECVLALEASPQQTDTKGNEVHGFP